MDILNKHNLQKDSRHGEITKYQWNMVLEVAEVIGVPETCLTDANRLKDGYGKTKVLVNLGDLKVSFSFIDVGISNPFRVHVVLENPQVCDGAVNRISATILKEGYGLRLHPKSYASISFQNMRTHGEAPPEITLSALGAIRLKGLGVEYVPPITFNIPSQLRDQAESVGEAEVIGIVLDAMKMMVDSEKRRILPE